MHVRPIEVERTSGLLPSGPPNWVYTSVCHASLCTLLRGFGAMNGSCHAGLTPLTGWGVAGLPMYGGVDGAGPVFSIGVTASAAGAASRQAATAPARWRASRGIA